MILDASTPSSPKMVRIPKRSPPRTWTWFTDWRYCLWFLVSKVIRRSLNLQLTTAQDVEAISSCQSTTVSIMSARCCNPFCQTEAALEFRCTHRSYYFNPSSKSLSLD